MPRILRITIRFLDPTFHGRGDGAESEWPPSPLRLFQALVAASAARWNERVQLSHANPALEWIAKQLPPTILSAVGIPSDETYRLYVPNNASDLVAGAWKRGNRHASIADHRTEKDVRPTHIVGDAVHYLYPIADAAEFAKHRDTLVAAARSVTHLGWGVDMVAGNAVEMSEDEVAKLSREGERWSPTPDRSGTQLRVPRADTLGALMRKHEAFLGRLQADGFRPVPPLTAFEVVGYRRDTDTAERPCIAFELRTPDFEKFQPYDPARWTPGVAGMVRNAVAVLANQMRPFGWTDEHINTFVHGHTADGNNRAQGELADCRFSYLPLPSLEHRPAGLHVGSIRRVLIAAPPEHRAAVRWARVLSGQELSPLGGTRPAGLRLIDRPEARLATDPNLRHYVGEARAWSTVTPVVLPGYDDRDAATAERLLRRAFCHAGFSDEVVRTLALEWRNVGFRAGVDLASRYCLPEHLNGPRYHVRVRFAHPVRGPLAVGAGRYRGLGLFATE